MPDIRVGSRLSLVGAVLSITGSVFVCTAAFTSSDEYDTSLLGIGVVVMLTASAVLFASVKRMRQRERS